MAAVDQDIIVFLNQMVVITGSMDLFSPSPPVRDLPAIYRILNDAADQSGVKERILSVLPLDLVDALIGKITCNAVHIYYLASNAYLYDLVLGKQGLPIQVLQIGKQCPDGCLLLCKQCTDPDLRQFLHRLVGNTSQTQKSHFVRAARFLQNASLCSYCC